MAWTKLTKTISTFINMAQSLRSFLLKEDGFCLLLEDGGKILIEPITGVYWSNQTKN